MFNLFKKRKTTLTADTMENTKKTVADKAPMETSENPKGTNKILEKDTYGKDCTLETIHIEEGITTLKRCAIMNCTNLKEIYIPKSVSIIEPGFLLDCLLLEKITVDERNSVFDSRNGCNAIIEKKTQTLVLGCKSTKIPQGVRVIGIEAFHTVSGLFGILIPEGITTIDEVAFARCGNLRAIHLPNSLRSIKQSAFLFCEALKEVILPEGLTEIGEECFEFCTSLNKVDIPSSLMKIGSSALSMTDLQNELYIPKNVKEIGSSAIRCNDEFGCLMVTVCCETESKPEGFADDWCDSEIPVRWGVKKGNNSLQG